MTDCPDPNRLAELVDGRLPGTARLALEGHLDHCLVCTELIGELAHVVTPGITARAFREASSLQATLALWRDVIRHVATAGGAVSPDSVIVGDGGAITLARATEPAYTAPEVLRGGARTAASDQFALCAALWELAAGKPPFRGATIGALAVAMLRPPVAPGDGPRWLYRVLARGLAADPAARWPSLDALAAALAAPRTPRSPALFLAAAALVAAALAAIVLR